MPFGGSNYNGLQTQLTRRLQNGLLINASYTYSRTFDDSTADFNSTALNPRRPQDSQNIRAEYSRSVLDRPHRLTSLVVYDLPFFKNSNFFMKNLVGNWELAPSYTFQSPQYTHRQSISRLQPQQRFRKRSRLHQSQRHQRNRHRCCPSG